MLNVERDILNFQEALLKLGMDISILEMDNENYAAIFKSDNKASKDLNGYLALPKNYRLNESSSPVIMLVRIGVKQ